jgi:hypothetical protein
MKVFIVKNEVEHEYTIAKVSDSLVAEFELLHKERIVVEGSTIQDVMIKFAARDKQDDLPFNPELQKVTERK